MNILKIRPEQMATLDAEALKKFEDRTVGHLRKYFPAHFEHSKEPNIREAVMLGLARARTHNVRKEPAVRSYIDHMMMLGSFFDEDPQLPWAREILDDPERPDEYERMDALHARTMGFLDEAVGPDAKFLFRAVARARQNRLDPGIDVPPPRREAEVAAWLRRIYPEKSAAIGYQSAAALIAKGNERAAEVGFQTPRGRGAVIGMMHLVGFGFDRDPLLPWARETLAATAAQAEPARVEALLASSEAFAAGFIAWERGG